MKTVESYLKYEASELTVTAGSVTVTREDFGRPGEERGQTVISVDWTSSSGGAVTVVLPTMVGFIARVATNPDGDAAPTDLYDVALNDRDGLDLLKTGGANRSTSNSEDFVPFVSDATPNSYSLVPVAGEVTLAITNAGNVKQGVIRIYLK